MLNLERHKIDPPKGKPILEALGDYCATKKHRSDDRRGKIRLLITRMAEYLGKEFGRKMLADATKLELEKFTQTWRGPI
jgi:hypothetical protein